MKSHSMKAWLAVPLGLRLRLHLLLLCFVSSALASSWSYTNSSSWEDKWSSVASQMCSGPRQSPIALSLAESYYNPHLKPITVYEDYGFRPYEKFTVTNNGHTLMVTLPSCHYFLRLKANGGGRFCIAQFHFHWGKDSSTGSEHSIDGKFFPLEMHVVTFDKTLYNNFSAASTGVNGLAVLALVFQEDPNIPVKETVLYQMGAFLQKVDKVQQPGQTTQLAPFPVEAFLNVGRANERYYRYEGSLTTPPCTENVYWTVIAQPVPVSPQQLRAMRVMRYPEEEEEPFMANNYRGIQSINSGDVVVPRLVFRSWNAATRVAFASLPLLSAALFLARL